MKYFVSTLLCFFILCFVKAQQIDSINKIKKADSIIYVKDSLTKDSIAKAQILYIEDSLKKIQDSTSYNLIKQYSILNKLAQPQYLLTCFKEPINKNLIFYLLLGITILFGIIRAFFNKYIKNVFSIIFQTQFRQTQTREQLSQDNVASFLLNILFILTFSLFISKIILLNKYSNESLIKLMSLSAICLVVIYLFKLTLVKFLGYVFNKKNAASTYTFIVFMINKIIGIAFLPVLFFISLSTLNLSYLFLKIAIVVLLILFLFRFFVTYKILNRILNINAIHFFLYFCSIEILPLLIIFKFLSKQFSSGI